VAVRPDPRKRLLAAARRAAARAYAPYSKFRVGAAVLAGGTIITGCNVENASYGLTLCAERAALAAAVALGKRRITHLALASPDAKAGTLVPCGACLQWIAELAPKAEILIDGDLRTYRLTDLLPMGFAFAPPKPGPSP
jgi:cytidine deaminase